MGFLDKLLGRDKKKPAGEPREAPREGGVTPPEPPEAPREATPAPPEPPAPSAEGESQN
jgi:hypothetical protein